MVALYFWWDKKDTRPAFGLGATRRVSIHTTEFRGGVWRRNQFPRVFRHESDSKEWGIERRAGGRTEEYIHNRTFSNLLFLAVEARKIAEGDVDRNCGVGKGG